VEEGHQYRTVKALGGGVDIGGAERSPLTRHVPSSHMIG